MDEKEIQIHTAFNLQSAVLLIQRVSSQVHHACCGRGDSETHRVRADIKDGMRNTAEKLLLDKH